MKLTFLCHEFPPLGGGASTALDALTIALARQNYSVQIITIGYRILKTEHHTDSFGREIVRLPAFRRSLLAPGGMELLLSLAALSTISGFHVKRFHPDVIIAYFAFPAGLSGLLLARLFRIPLVVSLRGSDVPGFSAERWGKTKKLQSILLEPVWKYADLMIANGTHLATLGESAFDGMRANIKSVPNGVNTDQFKPHANKRTNGRVRLLFVGQLIARKRCAMILEAIKSSDVLLHGTELTVVGDGPLHEALSKQAEMIGPSAAITFLGAVSRDKMPEIYAENEVIIHLSKAEGVSNVIMESISAGLVIVATNTAVDPEIAGSLPDLLPDDSLSTLTNRLVELVQNRGTINSISQRNRTLALQYDWKEQGIKFIETISSFLAKREKDFSA